MKIYKKFVFDMKTGKEIESESFEYDGEVALCKGGWKAPRQTYTPAPTPEPAPEKAQTKQIDASQTTARENQRQKAQRAKGIRSSILTKQQDGATGGGNTLLGQ